MGSNSGVGHYGRMLQEENEEFEKIGVEAKKWICKTISDHIDIMGDVCLEPILGISNMVSMKMK